MASICINDALTDDLLRLVLSRLDGNKDKDVFSLVCKRWLHLQSIDRKKLAGQAGSYLLCRVASRFTQIVELDFSQSIARSGYPGITDSELFCVAGEFKCLKVLNLHNCKGITDRGWASMGWRNSLLQFLDVSYCSNLSDKGISAIAIGCRDLRTLHLAGCVLIGYNSLSSLSERCHDLETLGLQGCLKIGDLGLTCLVKGCKKIKSLDISHCRKVRDDGVSSVVKACGSSLKTLKLLECESVGHKSILALAQFCKNLETLVIGQGRGDVSDESIKVLVDSCKDSLKNLRMVWCSNVTDTSFSYILKQCKNLEALDISCCLFTDIALLDLESNEVLGLKVLKVSHCSKFTVTGIGKLLERCSSLEYLDVRFLPHVTEESCSEAGLVFPKGCKVYFPTSLNVLS